MSNAIVKARSTDGEIIMALAPLYVAYPNSKPTDELIDFYKKMLCDIEPAALARAVLAAVKVCKFMPTVADIREHLTQDVERAPGPRNDVDPATLPDIPKKMFRLDPEEDKKQRMDQLRRTQGWAGYYS